MDPVPPNNEFTNDGNTLYYTALFEYTRVGDTELSFKEGEILAVLDNSGDWWYAQNGHEEAGWVPPSYLDVDSPIPYEIVYNQFLEDSVHEDDLPPNLADPIEDAPAPFLGSLGGSRRSSLPAVCSSPDMSIIISPAASIRLSIVDVDEANPTEGDEEPQLSPVLDTAESSPGNVSINDFLRHQGHAATDDSAEEKDLDFSSKINDWCRTTSKVMNNSVKEDSQDEPGDAPMGQTAEAWRGEPVTTVISSGDNGAVAAHERVKNNQIELQDEPIVKSEVCASQAEEPAATTISSGDNGAAVVEEYVAETVDIVLDVFVRNVVESLAADGESKDSAVIVQAIEGHSDSIMSGLLDDADGYDDDFEDELPAATLSQPSSDLVVYLAQVAVSKVMDAALGRRLLQRRIVGCADRYVQEALSGAVVRISERILNQRYRAAHARQITRTISKPLATPDSPFSPIRTKKRSMSVATHDPSRVVEVMQLREAKIRLLSMERIELMSRPLTPPLDDCEENPFEEAKTEEPLRPFSRSLKTARPKSSNAHLPSRSTLEFDKALRSTNCSSRMFIKQFQIQRSQRARKNAKAVFDALQKSISAGESVNISVHDYISTIIRPVPGRPSSGAREGWALHKSSSTGQAKKGKRSRSGMVIYVDPSIDTTDIQCVLHVEYGPQFSQKQSITVSNDGSYCGLELTGASWNLNTKTPTIAPLSVKQDVDLNRLAISFDIEAQDRSLPGWCGTLPIFIPVDRCRCRLEVKKNQKVFDLSQSPLRFYYGSKAVGPAFPLRAMPGLPERPRTAPLTPIRTDTRKVSEDALEKLSVFCFAASSVEAAIRIVNDCVGPKLRRDVANDDAGGGSSSLHVASLHGNIEGVRHLVDSAGASVNARCKRSNHTPLHEAIIGGHAEVVAFLIEKGANVLLRDNTDSLPIHIACANNHVSIVRMLLNSKYAKKSLLAKDGKGKTARQLCASKFLRTIVEDTMRKMYIYKTCTLLEKGNRGQELFEMLAKPLLTRPITAPIFRPDLSLRK